MKRIITIFVLAGIASSPPLAAQNTNYQYTATTRDPAVRQGAVIAASIRWNCIGNRCTVSGPWPKPGESACSALAEQVGVITSYGHATARLDAAQLDRCNKSAAAAKNVLTPGPVRQEVPVETVVIPEVPTAMLASAPPSDIIDAPSRRWRCRSNLRCETMNRTPNFEARHAVLVCADLAQAAGRITYFSDSRIILNADQLARCNAPYVRDIEVVACSGSDDLRSNTELRIGPRILGRTSNNGRYRDLFSGIPSNACKTARLNMGGYPVTELQGYDVQFRSRERSAFDEPDKWDMVQFSVTATVTDPGGRRYLRRIVDRRHNPVKRFDRLDSWYTEIDH